MQVQPRSAVGPLHPQKETNLESLSHKRGCRVSGFRVSGPPSGEELAPSSGDDADLHACEGSCETDVVRSGLPSTSFAIVERTRGKFFPEFVVQWLQKLKL